MINECLAPRGKDDKLSLDPVVIDFETYWDDDYTLSKLTTEAYVRDARFEVIGVSVRPAAGPCYWLEEHQFRHWLATLDPSRLMTIAHHAHFDGLILSHHYGFRPGFWIDTLSMSRATWGPVAKHGLDDVSKRLGRQGKLSDIGQKYKGFRRRDMTDAQFQEYGLYANRDTDETWHVAVEMLKDFPRIELEVIDIVVRMFTEPLIELDVPKLGELLAWETKRRAEVVAEVVRILEEQGKLPAIKKITDPNELAKKVLNSNNLFADVLRHFGIEPGTKLGKPSKKTGLANTTYAFAKTDPFMQELLESDDEDVRLLAEARVLAKSTQTLTRTQRLIQSAGRGQPVPVYLAYSPTHTHRLGGGDKMNWQNLERTNKKDPNKGRIRKAIAAPEGYKLVPADSSQIEARFTGYIAGHEGLIQQFRNRADVYSEFASIPYRRKIDRKKNPEDEIPGHVGKTCVLGLGFGMGAFKLALEFLKGANGGPVVQFTWADMEKLGVEHDFLKDEYSRARVQQMVSRLSFDDLLVHVAVADYLVRTWREANKPIVDYWKFCDQVVIPSMFYGDEVAFGPGNIMRTAKDMVILPNGLTIKYTGLKMEQEGRRVRWSYLNRSFERTGLYGGKATENQVQALAYITVAEQMVNFHRESAGRWPIKMMTHDEFVPVAPEAEAQLCLDTALRIMQTPPSWCPGVPLSAEGSIARYYGDAK